MCWDCPESVKVVVSKNGPFPLSPSLTCRICGNRLGGGCGPKAAVGMISMWMGNHWTSSVFSDSKIGG